MLLIHSYHSGFEWTDRITDGVMEGFGATDKVVRLSVEYLDSKLHELSEVAENFRALCALKYSENPPDVILCSDNNALEFLVEYRLGLFPETPIVFCGIHNFSDDLLGGASIITGVIEEPSYRETAELALAMHPDTTRIYALACSTAPSRIHMERFMRSVRGMDPAVEIIPLHDLSLQEFAEALEQTVETDLIINLALHRMGEHDTLSVREAYRFIRAHTAAPIYNLWSAYLQTQSEFLAGGVMIDGEVQGKLIAEMALKIIEGTPVSQLPIVTDSPNVPLLNYRELERLGRSSLAFPDDVLVINRPFSFYETYHVLVWSVVVVIWGMTTLIIFLYISMRRRRRAEAELRIQGMMLREREEKLRVTLDSIAEAVITTDVDGGVQHLNPVAEALTGWRNADAVQRPIGEVFNAFDADSREPLVNPVEELVAKDGPIIRGNHTLLISRNADEYQIVGSGALIRDDHGLMIGVVLVFRDITEKLVLQDRLRQSQKMDAIGQLAGGIAHDFNNMLGGIVAATEMAQIELREEKDPTDLLDMVLASADRAASLTTKLLAFARKQPIESSPVEIHQPLQEALTLFAHTADKRIRIHGDLSGAEQYVTGDFSLLQSVFLNLFINASHAMPAGGDLYISAKPVELDRSYCEQSTFDLHPGPFIEVEVRDTGAGIPEILLSRIFEPFFTTKDIGKGTGLGLAAVLGTIQQHGGTITVHSELEIGTRFCIILPLTEQHPEQSDDLPSEQVCGTGTILVVDDEKIMRETCQMILEDFGYEVLLADNGIQGLEWVEKEAGRIDLILLDMVMPEMNGRDCFKAIRAIRPDMRIIMSSGVSRLEELGDLKEQGLCGVLHKPYRRLELGKMVQMVLQEKNGS
ncbi:MAG: response regulator [Pontiella sp.]